MALTFQEYMELLDRRWKVANVPEAPVTPNGLEVPRPKMSLGGDFEDGYGEFLGVVITDDWEYKTFQDGRGGWQWHLAVRPVDFAVGGDTQAFHTWYPATKKENSKMGAARIAMQTVFPADLEIGEHSLEGHVCWWKRETLEFGTNSKTGETMKAEDVLIPLRVATDEETKRGKAVVGGYPGAGSAVQPVAEAQADALGDAEIEKVLALINGKTKREIKVIGLSKDTDLPREIKQGLISGKLLTQLIEDGYLLAPSEDSGAYERVEVPF